MADLAIPLLTVEVVQLLEIRVLSHFVMFPQRHNDCVLQIN